MSHKLILTFLVLCSAAATMAADPPRKPNIVFIIADDVGYGDLGCYGATQVATPNLDRLAAAGRRFTDAHTPSAMCSPTRYSVMTGQYAFRHAPVAKGVLSGVAPLAIPLDRLTVPKMLKSAGYATGCVGKWHLGLGQDKTDFNGEIKPGPLEIGFDYFFGLPATGDRTPCVYVENHRVVNLDPSDPIKVNYQNKIGDDPTGAARPDLLKVKPSHGHDNTIVNGISRIGWMTGGKSARWVDEDMADTFTSKAVGFIERSKDEPFFLYFATHDAHVPRVPHPRFAGKSPHGTRGDVIMELDWCVGQVMETLDKLKLTDNTLIMFTSDNGGVMDDGYIDGTATDASGHRCCGPLRGYKGGLYEGGHRVPFIARWPGHVPVGSSDSLICVVDMLATLADLAGQKLPQNAAPDSIDVLPALLGEPGKGGRENLIMHAGGGGLAVRQGSWKMIPKNPNASKTGRNPTSGETELYDLSQDLAEKKSLAKANPKKVEELTALLAKLRESGRSRP